VVGVASLTTSLSEQIAILGVLISILVGLVLTWLDEQAQLEDFRAELSVQERIASALADDPALGRVFRKISQAFLLLSKQREPVLRSTAATKLLSMSGELDQMARGIITFNDSEAWRTAYQELLLSETLRLYRSAAWVKCETYWQDPPGWQSLRDNYDAINRGVIVERIFILPSMLWPVEQRLPSETVLPWITDQHNHGVWVMLCRESDVYSEPDLPQDFGIYGDLAVGTQILDQECRTREFIMDFSSEAVQLANDRWQRLKLFTTSLRSLLDNWSDDS